jgi:hypothetical protein
MLREIGTPEEPHQVACHHAEKVTGEEWHRLSQELLQAEQDRLKRELQALSGKGEAV